MCAVVGGYVVIILVILLYQVKDISAAAESGCRLKKEWRGTWYQYMAGNMEIRGKSIQDKGHCVASDPDRDFYLFKNRTKGCYSCVLMVERHENLLQYRETYCMPHPRHRHNLNLLTMICRDITQDSPLHTLVREPAEPVPCPIDQSYTFKYDYALQGSCDQMTSQLRPCAGGTQLSFHFDKCGHVEPFREQDRQLKCLATWKDGSDRYLYGIFQANHAQPKDATYRCFKYEQYGSDVYLSMSMDPTCRELFSARSGPLSMHLKPETTGRPDSTCHFPSWLEGISWRDLRDQKLYNMSDSGRTLKAKNKDSNSDTEMSCVDVVSDTRDSKTFLVFSTSNCLSSYACLSLHRLTADILEMSYLQLSGTEDRSKCALIDGGWDREVLTVATENVRACPLPGVYEPLVRNPKCSSATLVVGCPTPASLRYLTGCHEERAFALECRTVYTARNTSHVIASPPGSKVLICVSLSFSNNVLSLNSDPRCSFRPSSTTPALESFTRIRDPEPCSGSYDVDIGWPDDPINSKPRNPVNPQLPPSFPEHDHPRLPDPRHDDGYIDIKPEVNNNTNSRQTLAPIPRPDTSHTTTLNPRVDPETGDYIYDYGEDYGEDPNQGYYNQYGSHNQKVFSRGSPGIMDRDWPGDNWGGGGSRDTQVVPLDPGKTNHVVHFDANSGDKSKGSGSSPAPPSYTRGISVIILVFTSLTSLFCHVILLQQRLA